MSGLSRGWCSPERYIQGAGEINNLKLYTDKLGTKIVALVDHFLYEDNAFKQKLNAMYDDGKHMPFPVTENTVFAAIKTADAYGKRVKKDGAINEQRI